MKRLFLLTLCSCLAIAQGFAQTTATLTANGLGQSPTVTITLLPPSVDTLSVSVGSLSAVPGGTVAFDVSSSTTRLMPAALQFTLSAPATSVSGFTVTAGAAATAAGKTISCQVPTSPAPPAGTTQVNCVVTSVSQTCMGNGAVAHVVAQLAPTAVSGAITLGNSVSVNVNSNVISSTITPATVALTVTAPVSVSVACATDPNVLVPAANQIEPGEVLSCTLTLSAAQTTATSVILTSSATTSPGFTVPATVLIPTGALSAPFQVTGI